MKIEIFYDSVVPQTIVIIDEKYLNDKDIYGFLYPVKNHLLQTWLQPQGSWKGISFALDELLRGDHADLVFYGKKSDYIDFSNALSNNSNVSLKYHEWNCEQVHRDIFREIDALISKAAKDEKYTLDGAREKTGEELFPEFFSEQKIILSQKAPDWMTVIKNEKDFQQADKKQGVCCFVDDSYLDSYEKLQSLEYLSRSMRRSMDMIICCVPVDSKRKEFERYAGQFPGYEYRFVGTNTEKIKKELLSKYGNSFKLRFEREKYQLIINKFVELMNLKSKLKQTIKEFELNKDIKRVREMERNRSKQRWIARKSDYVDKMQDLINNEIHREIEKTIGKS